MKRLTKKQFIKRRVNWILYEILKGLVDEKDHDQISLRGVYNQFPKVSYYKEEESGVIRVGLSFRGVKKLVKKYPMITPAAVKLYFNVA